jgi:hypothetical protein
MVRIMLRDLTQPHPFISKLASVDGPSLCEDSGQVHNGADMRLSIAVESVKKRPVQWTICKPARADFLSKSRSKF